MNDIDLKLGRLFKLEKRNMIKLKKFGNDVILVNYVAIVVFLIYCRFEAIGKPDCKC